MTDVAALIADMVRSGIDPEIIGRTAAALAEREPVLVADEQAERRRAADRERKAAKRAAKDGIPQNSADSAETPPPSSPRQKAPQTPKKTHPLSPPTPPIGPPPQASKPDEIADRLWSLASKISRSRSTRPEVRRATSAAIKQGATEASLTASVQAMCRDSGEFAKGLHRIIAGEFWREHGADPPAIARLPTPEERAYRARHLADTGEWREEWGQRPKTAMKAVG